MLFRCWEVFFITWIMLYYLRLVWWLYPFFDLKLYWLLLTLVTEARESSTNALHQRFSILLNVITFKDFVQLWKRLEPITFQHKPLSFYFACVKEKKFWAETMLVQSCLERLTYQKLTVKPYVTGFIIDMI